MAWPPDRAASPFLGAVAAAAAREACKPQRTSVANGIYTGTVDPVVHHALLLYSTLLYSATTGLTPPPRAGKPPSMVGWCNAFSLRGVEVDLWA